LEEKTLSIRDYLSIGFRRKWFIIIPFFAAVFISYGVYKYLPKVYKSTTLILVQPQRVPEAYVRPTITETVSARLNTISQEILSRTRLEKVIQELNLYPEVRQKAPMEEVIEITRRSITVEVQSRSRDDRSQNTFSLSYEGQDPRTVMLVTNKLASLFIEENLKVREMQAESTSDFIIKELQSMEDQLKKKDQAIRSFKERNMGNLPQQLDANLRILERLQQQLQTTNETIKTAEDRAFILQGQIEQLKRSVTTQVSIPGTRREAGQEPEAIREEAIPEDLLVTQLNNLKRELGIAQSKYTESHPDVIDLRKRISSLEPQVEKILKEQEAKREARLKELKARQERARAGTEDQTVVVTDPATQRLLDQYTTQFHEAQLEAKRLRAETKNIKDQIVVYQRRIEETPKREEELALLTRDYDLLRTNHQSLLDKKIQSQMSENLERKQQGEQFKVLDPARMPEVPIRPDLNRILLMGAGIGLMLGLGLAYFRETWNQKFHTEAEVEQFLGIPVIAVIPNLKEDKAA
jgi:polysaccharide chain length determinant protein (PEP-CTERM system associated)